MTALMFVVLVSGFIGGGLCENAFSRYRTRTTSRKPTVEPTHVREVVQAVINAIDTHPEAWMASLYWYKAESLNISIGLDLNNIPYELWTPIQLRLEKHEIKLIQERLAALIATQINNRVSQQLLKDFKP